MPRASKETASQVVEVEGYEGRMEELGGWTVAFERYSADADLAPFFAGLPDDRCQSPHLGYVFRGKVTFTFADGREETYEAGDAYYVPPGHTPIHFAGAEIVEFSPTDALGETIGIVLQNLRAVGVET